MVLRPWVSGAGRSGLQRGPGSVGIDPHLREAGRPAGTLGARPEPSPRVGGRLWCCLCGQARCKDSPLAPSWAAERRWRRGGQQQARHAPRQVAGARTPRAAARPPPRRPSLAFPNDPFPLGRLLPSTAGESPGSGWRPGCRAVPAGCPVTPGPPTHLSLPAR